MSLGTTYSTTVPVGEAASYKLWPAFAYSNGYWEVYRRFQGYFFGWKEGLRRGGYVGETFHGGIFVMGEEDFHEGGAAFSSIIKKKMKK